MKLLILALIATTIAFGCTAPNKFCVFENALVGRKCIQLDTELTAERCQDLGGVPAKDCGK